MDASGRRRWATLISFLYLIARLEDSYRIGIQCSYICVFLFKHQSVFCGLLTSYWVALSSQGLNSLLLDSGIRVRVVLLMVFIILLDKIIPLIFFIDMWTK